MDKQVLFIHGAGDGAHAEDAKLVESLREALGPGYRVRYPAMPDEAEPDGDVWAGVIAAELADMGDGPRLVGHSAGAAILGSFLSGPGSGTDVAGLFLISAPYGGEGGWEIEGFTTPPDLGRRLPDAPVFLYHGDADEIVPVSHLALYARAIPRAVVRRLEGRDHQLDEDMSEVARDILDLDRAGA
jgi:pimeloyl-ACP methyl ester carboxylesterase